MAPLLWSSLLSGAGTPTPVGPAGVFVEVELGGVGLGWTDITNDVLQEEGIIIRRGMTGGGPTDHVASTGTATFALRNDQFNSPNLIGCYSLNHANKRPGWGLGIGCRIYVRDHVGDLYTQMVGRLDAIAPTAGQYGERRVRVMVVDWIDEAARWKITPECGEQIEKRGDQVLAGIISKMPLAPLAQVFDTGAEVYAVALDTSADTTALEEFGKLAASEFGYIYVTCDGTLRYEGRHERMLSTGADWVLTGADIQGLEVPSLRDDVLNTVRVNIHPKTVDATPTTVVYNQANVITIEPGISKMLLGDFNDPVTGDTIGATEVQPLEAFTDYMASRDSPEGEDRTSYMDASFGLVVGQHGVRMVASHSHATTLYLTKLQLRGRGIYDFSTVKLEASDTESIALYGEHGIDYHMPYQSDDDVGRGTRDYILIKYKNPFAQARSVTVMALTPAMLTQLARRDISDRLKIQETMTGINSDFFINGMEKRFLSSMHQEVTYILAPATDPVDGAYWVLDVSILGTNTVPAPFQESSHVWLGTPRLIGRRRSSRWRK